MFARYFYHLCNHVTPFLLILTFNQKKKFYGYFKKHKNELNLQLV